MGGVGVGPEVAAAAGERWRVRRRRWVEFGFFKKERKKVVTKTATACLNKRLGFCLLGGSSFLL